MTDPIFTANGTVLLPNGCIYPRMHMAVFEVAGLGLMRSAVNRRQYLYKMAYLLWDIYKVDSFVCVENNTVTVRTELWESIRDQMIKIVRMIDQLQTG